MRKQTKLVAVLSAAALLAVGASMTSFAASKWVLEGEDWVYLDSNGERECNVWRRSNDNYYYLDEDGIMARDTLIDDDGTFYYVDENGVRITNAWKELPNDDGAEVGSEDADDNIPEVLYYYFGSTGKAYTAGGDGKKVRLIEGQYYMFNDDGQMYSGWQTNGDDLYYFGDEKEGWARKNWQYLEPKEETTDEDGNEYDELEWYYFGTNGKATKEKSLYISGAYYQFDTNGVMKDGWYTSTATQPTVAAGAKAYAGSSGSQASGWVYTSDPDDSDDMYWYYLVSVKDGQGKTTRGIPFNYQADSSEGARAATIKSKTYLFGMDGKMLTGFVVINDASTGRGDINDDVKNAPECTEIVDLAWTSYDSSSVTVKKLENGLYYFNESAGSTEGQMQTGRKAITKDGETFYYYFDTTDGYAHTNEIKSGYLYGPDGKCVVAESGSSYSVYTLEEDVEGDYTLAEGSQVVVSRTGKIKVNGSVKIDGTTYNVSGCVATVKE